MHKEVTSAGARLDQFLSRNGVGIDERVTLISDDAGEFVKVQGSGNRHREKLELVLERIRRVSPEQDRLDGFREEDCIPSAPRPIDDWLATGLLPLLQQ